MSIANDTRFWDRTARKYAKAPIADQQGYERTLDRTRSLLKADDRVLELGCGTGTTALRLAGAVKHYLATDFSPSMIAIAEEKRVAARISTLEFRTASADTLAPDTGPFNAVLGFNYLHLVRDLPGTLRRIHALLGADGLFISKTACLGDMNPLLRTVLLPLMRAIGKAPYVGAFDTAELSGYLSSAGFDVLATESHSSKGRDNRPYIVARRK